MDNYSFSLCENLCAICYPLYVIHYPLNMRVLLYNDKTGVRGGTETYVNSIKREMEGRGFVVERLTIDVREFSAFGQSRFSKVHKFRDGLFFKRNVGEAIERKLGEFQPDLIHINNNAYFTTTILKVANRHRIPTVQTIHDYRLIPKNGESILARFIKKIRLNIVKKNTTHFIAPSYKFEKILQENGVINVTYIPHYIEVEKWKTAEEHTRQKRILYIGRFEVVKGIFVLLNAWKKIAQDLPDYELIFIGEGGESENLHTKIAKNNLHKQTKILPFQSQEIIKKYLYESELIVVPSAYREMFGLIGLEAFACEIPVIASDVAGIPEWCIHEKTGLLVEMENSDELAQAIQRILKDKTLAEQLTKEGKVFLNEAHDKQKALDILEKLYRNLS